MQTENENILWLGEFTAGDRAEIEALRLGQAAAIERGDTEAYARLVADDIHLMLPGRDIVAGRAQFMAYQSVIFSGTKFVGMKKHPIRVERSGDLVVEVGRQELAAQAGTFAPQQKYTHVMRKTPAGWRFAVLMSNNSV
jgi:ketosteroid isomerase-like protein